jgi:SagB-type dehydrogenase family enzyme
MKLLRICMVVLGVVLGSQALGLAAELIKLPPPSLKGAMSVEEALSQRRSVRQFANRGLEMPQVAQLLWAASGVTDPGGKRTAPSGRAAYPLEFYLVAGERGVSQLPAGVYRYHPKEHSLEQVGKGDQRGPVAKAANNQAYLTQAPIIVVIAGEYARSKAKNSERGVRYTIMEAGLAGENLLLQTVALGLGAGCVGGFNDAEVSRALSLPREHEPLLILPLGYK